MYNGNYNGHHVDNCKSCGGKGRPIIGGVASGLMLLTPFPDDGQGILYVFLRVGIGIGV